MDDIVEDGDDKLEDSMTFEDERCGICSDVVFDRGVLDCCEDWFCLKCIENWAAITNCCPLCKNEFQKITWIPVFDGTGSFRTENPSVFRDVDWNIEVENNALSFPSYYIDEDAVVCLDADGCKVRNGLSLAEGDLTPDTSIACDSCDIWYHACCVGFNPEAASDSTWLCPRCTPYEELPKSDHSTIQGHENQSVSKCATYEWATDPTTLMRKVSVAVDDDGETAVVVSMIQGDNIYSPVRMETKQQNDTENGQVNEMETKNKKSFHDGITEDKDSYKELSETSNEMNYIQSDGGLMDGTYTSRALKHAVCEVSNRMEENIQNQNSGSMSCYGHQPSCGLTQNISNLNALLDKLVSSSVEETFPSPTLNSLDGIPRKESELNGLVTTEGDKFNLRVMDSDLLNSQNAKRKGVHVEMKAECDSKKAKSDDRLHIMPSGSGSQKIASASSYFHSSINFNIYMDKNTNFVKQDEVATAEIMSIVKEVDDKSDYDQEGRRPLKLTLDKGENSAGLRVKKIMRRGGDGKERAILTKEIKDAVHSKFSSDGKDGGSSSKLLSAFREAIVKSKSEVAGNFDPSLLKMRKNFLQKGKVRENLTKKIYGTSNGRRRKAWDRDWEIEFWKYRCSSTKNEDIETLVSVLEFLKKPSTSCSGKEETGEEQGKAEGSILDRIYLADASVFPRKDDIKPLSDISKYSEANIAHSETSMIGAQSDRNNLLKISQGSNNSQTRSTDVQIVGTNLMSAPIAVQLQGHTLKTPASQPSSRREQNHKEVGNQPVTAKTDKKKWALEVLARKNAVNSFVRHEQEDETILKGNFPLLAQLPSDMRPVPEPSGHNKVPVSVRQVQLYRITEEFLRKTNLTAIRKTAMTELAIIDATNVEKGIYEKSNSKNVYLNLCAQYLSECNKPQGDATMSNQVKNMKDRNNQLHRIEGYDQSVSETISEFTYTVYDNAEEALRDAGLSDSPPSSPRLEECSADAASPLQDSVGAHENVVGVDNNIELDIDKKINCNLADVDHSAFLVPIASKLLNSEGNTKTKVTLVTPKFEVLHDCLDTDTQKSKHLEKVSFKGEGHNASSDCQDLFQHRYLCSKENVLEDVDINVQSTSEPAEENECNGFFLGEGVNLHGPKKEHFTMESSTAVERDCKMMVVDAADGNNISAENENMKLEDVSEFPKPDECCSGNWSSDNKTLLNWTSFGESCATHSVIHEKVQTGVSETTTNKLSESVDSVTKKVEAFVKEHLRPLCKIGVITVQHYRLAVSRTTKKVMEAHSEDKDANFLIKEGDKVKKLAEQYVEYAQRKKIK